MNLPAVLPFLSRKNSRSLARRAAGSAILLLAAFTAEKASAYSLESGSWPAGSTVTFQMALGSAGRTLSDGNTSWDTAAAPAAGIWNQSVQRVRFVPTTNPSAPLSTGDRINTVAFASTFFGQSFGSNTLAVTYWRSMGSNITEADIIFNNRQAFDSYRGSLRSGSDIRRVLLHEMGHALGLGHPDQAGQHVSAVMNSVISNIDTATQDDIAGAQALYGAPQSSPTPTPAPTPTPTPSATPTPTPSATPGATPATKPSISLSVAPTSIRRGGVATFTFRTSVVNPNSMMIINYAMGGTTFPNYYSLSGPYRQAIIPAGAATTTVRLTSLISPKTAKTVTMTVTPGSSYNLAPNRTATVVLKK